MIDAAEIEPVESRDADEDIRLELKWVRTWPDRPDQDFCAPASYGHYGRIRLEEKAPQEGWVWHYHGAVPDGTPPPSGIKATARLAAQAVEDAWRGFGRPENQGNPPANRYAAAKDPG